jgi:hypothetical protein
MNCLQLLNKLLKNMKEAREKAENLEKFKEDLLTSHGAKVHSISKEDLEREEADFRAFIDLAST